MLSNRLVWLCGSALCLASAHGQDALFSSVSLDNSIAAQSVRPVGPHLGPVQFGVIGYAGVTYDDNVNGSPAPEPDFISRAGVSLNLGWQATGNSDLQLGTSVGYLDYLKYTGNNGLEISPNSALTCSISLAAITLTLFDQLSYSREVRTEAALANVTTLPQLDNNAGLRAEWDPGHWTLLASYSHDEFISDHANDFLNRAAEYFYARVGWRFAAATQAGLEASDALTRYQIAGQGNNQNLSVGGYLDWSLLPSLSFKLRGGPALFEPEGGSARGSSTVNTYYVSLAANQQLTDFLSHQLSVQRSLLAGINQGSSYDEQLTASYSISWAVTRRIALNVSANYVDGAQPLGLPSRATPNPGILLAETEDYQQYGGGLQVTWQCTGRLSAIIGYNHLLRRSNLPGRSYTDNSISFLLNYAF